MPRPKRSKITSTSSDARVTKKLAPWAPVRRNPARDAAIREDDLSEDTEGTVVTSRFTRKQASNGHQGQTIVMSGALEGGDRSFKPTNKEELDVLKLERTRRKELQEEANRILREDGEQLPVAQEETKSKARATRATNRGGRRRARTPPNLSNSQREPTKSKERRKETKIAASGEAHNPVTARLELDEGSTNAGTSPVVEESALVLANFRRRARKPSIIGQAIRSLQVSRAGSPMEDTFGDATLGDGDSFNPEDESTPFNITKSHLRPSPQPSEQQNPLNEVNSLKRKLAEVAQDLPSSPPAHGRTESPSMVNRDLSLPSSPLVLNEGLSRKRARTPDQDDEIMAPPLSSPLVSPERGRSAPKLPLPEKTSTRTSRINVKSGKKESRPSLSTVKLQELLPKRRRHAPKNAFDIPSSDSIVGVALNEEVLSEDTETGNEDDEDPRLPSTRSRRTTSVKPGKPPPPSMTNPPAKRGRKTISETLTPGTGLARTVNGTSSKLLRANASSARSTRTYGTSRRSSSDKENANDNSTLSDSLNPEDNSLLRELEGLPSERSGRGAIELDGAAKKQMKLLEKKFKDVDNWDLEFETVTASGSSQIDAR
ncbi:MAG: hypothetical protein M1824_003771 [Vezdaea acicularis]|nr:MAG: hypothetical protein M1824_003771 [Vezdaea acicularis]